MLGLNNEENFVYAIDCAFHYNGLNYKDTVNKVTSKLIKSALILKVYFGSNNGFFSYFITPKFTNKKDKKNLKELLDIVNKTLENEINCQIRIYEGDNFFDEFIEKLVKETNSEHNTNELFLRAVKLINLDKRKKYLDNKNDKARDEKNSSSDIKNKSKIGEFVQKAFKKAFKEGLISDKEIENLKNKEYCKHTFNINYAILKDKGEEIKDKNGYVRYYTGLFDDKYYLTSQWFYRHWEPLLIWLEKINCKL